MKNVIIILLSLSCFGFDIQYKQRTSATSGTVTIDQTGTDVQLIHTAALTATLTIAMPSSPYDGQIVSIASDNGITALTLSTGIGSILNAITTMAAGGTIYYMWDTVDSKWHKV